MEETFGENVQLDEDSFKEETQKKSKCPNKKILFFLLGIIIILIIILFGYFLINLKTSNKPSEIISEINCTFFIKDKSAEIQILSDEFKNNSKIFLKINGISQNFSKFVNFGKNETNEIQLII